MKNRDFTPLVMWFGLVAGIVVLACFRPGRMPGFWKGYPVNFDFVFIGLYILWMLMELRVSRRDVDTAGKSTSDSATCQIYGIGQAVTFLTALWFPSIWRTPNAAHCIGIALFLIGACYRAWAIRTLGEFYSHRVRIVTRHQVVDSGPYRFMRHPAYAGMIVVNVGIALFFCNWVTVCVFAFALVPSIVLRIVIEERTLLGVDGYAEYARGRRRLFPAIW